jgi:TonB family protein
MMHVRLLALALGAFAQLPAASPAPANTANAVDAPAFVREWTPAKYPPEALREKIRGRATVRIIVDAHGGVTEARVLSAGDPRFGEAALTAVRTWKFSPATESQKPVAMSMDVPFEFEPAQGDVKKPGLLPAMHLLPKPSPNTGADVKSAWIDDYPESLRSRKLRGRVIFEGDVTAEGRASAVRVLAATHADFVKEALAASPKWEFTPAMQGDLPVRGQVRGEVSIELPRTGEAAILLANNITAPDGSVPEQTPLLEISADPVWPHGHLLRGEPGSASAEFTVALDGSVTEVKLREATAPEFGRALVAALEVWRFEAARGSRSSPVALLKKASFAPLPADATEAARADPLGRLVILARRDSLRGGADLDERLTPLYRAAPIYPAALRAADKPSGEVTIEFVIDRDGRARMPRIVAASREEFGWAAATAVGQWLFRPPLRGGAPTEVKVQIPFNFTPPNG